MREGGTGFRVFLGAFLCIAAAAAASGAPARVTGAGAAAYSNSYAVAVSRETLADPGWRAVAESLLRTYAPSARQFAYAGKEGPGAESLRAALAGFFPKYVCFVMRPEEASFSRLAALHRMMRRWDADPYTDAIYAVLTAPGAEDALRIAESSRRARRTVVERALATTGGVDFDRVERAVVLSDGEKGLVREKAGWDAPVRSHTVTGETIRAFVSGWDRLDPDLLVTSSHASQRNLEMPFHTGNVVYRGGRLFGMPPGRSPLIDYSTGQAREGAEDAGGALLPMRRPERPKAVLGVGNCLIGDIPDGRCMALGWLGFGRADQFFGYSVPTWFGLAGWGLLGQWRQYPGTSVSEAYFFSNQNLLWRLSEAVPNERDFLPPARTPAAFSGDFNRAMRGFRFALPGGKMTQFIAGMLWDRDCTVLYGDPAREICSLSGRGGRPFAARRVSLVMPGTAGATNRCVVTALRDVGAMRPGGEPGKGDAPACAYFPFRIRDARVLDADGARPVLADNFILIPGLPAMKKGERRTIRFSGEPCGGCP